jgi:hypothetical protein
MMNGLLCLLVACKDKAAQPLRQAGGLIVPQRWNYFLAASRFS